MNHSDNPYSNDRPNGGFAQGKYNACFSEILQRLPGERKRIAADLGIPRSTYDNYIYGLQSFPPDLISRLFAITGDWTILEFILEPLDLQAIHKSRPNTIPKTQVPDVYRKLIDITEHLGQTIHEIKRAKADGKLDVSEYARIKYFTSEIERHICEVAEILKTEVRS